MPQEHKGGPSEDHHDYLRHTLDCLEEAQTALHLAQRRGQIERKDEAKLIRRIGTLTEDLSRVQPRN